MSRELTLTQAAAITPGRPHVKTVLRWIIHGVMGYRRHKGDVIRQRVYLEARKVGGQWFIRPEALDAFSRATTPPAQRQRPVPPRLQREREHRRHERAVHACHAMGITPIEGHAT